MFVQAAGFQCVLANRANSIIDSPVAELEMTLPPPLQLYGFRRAQHVRVLCALLTPPSQSLDSERLDRGTRVFHLTHMIGIVGEN